MDDVKCVFGPKRCQQAGWCEGQGYCENREKVRIQRAKSSFPAPSCCDTAASGVVIPTMYRAGTWHWVSTLSHELRKLTHKYEVEVYYCPGCGTKLPDLIPRDPPDPTIQIDKDMNRCLTCGEDRRCACHPLWATVQVQEPDPPLPSAAEAVFHRMQLWRLLHNNNASNDALVDFIGDWLSECKLLPEEEHLNPKDEHE